MTGNDKNKKKPLFLIVLGSLGMVATVWLIINKYINTKDMKTLLLIMVIGFFPFVISFSAIKIGITGLAKSK